MNTNKVFLALGSNKGNKIEYLKDALNLIGKLPETSINSYSSVYETAPFGFIRQDNFLNMAVEIFTELNPVELLSSLKNIEKQLGRKKSFKWGPREIDIDILLYEDLIISNEELTIPHRYLLERDFFLVPLLEINSEIIYPSNKKKLKDYLNLIETNHIINKFNINSFTR